MLVLAIIILLLFSCRDVSDYSAPVIVIFQPNSGHSLQVPDTLYVKGEVDDNRVIRSVTVALVNKDKIPVAPVRYFNPETSYFKISTYLVISDKSLKSGGYNLVVTASDGYQVRQASVTVNMIETPLTLLGYVAVTEPLSFKSVITRMDSNFETDTSFVFPKSFRLSGMSSLWEQFFFVSETPGVIHTFSTDTWEIVREYAAAPPRPEFTGLWVDRHLVFSNLNGDAGILNNYGNLVVRTPPAGGKTIQCLAADDKYIYAEHVSLNGAETELTVFYRPTGVIRIQRLLHQDITVLIPFDDKVLILSNTTEKAIISEYDPGSLKLTELSVLENVRIISALKIDDHLFLILTPEKVLMFNRYHNQVTDYLHATYQFGKYDSLNNYLYLVNGNVLDVIQFVTSNLVHQLVFDDKLVDFHIIYNK
ncbi:MAG: hypothetical protein K0B08_10215 [Bacteroidales bacterium]|nr:hypothetical protein [Bacteroidales bacterium]